MTSRTDNTPRSPARARLAVVFLVVVAMVACKPERLPGEGDRTSGRQRVDESAEQGLAAEEDLVLVEVNGRPITLGEFEARIGLQSGIERTRLRVPANRQDFLETLVQLEILAQEARRLGYDDSADVRVAVRDALARAYVSGEVAEQLRRADITDEDVAAWYAQHADRYNRPEQRRAIEVTVESREEAARLLEEYEHRRRLAPPDSQQLFLRMAAEHSIDPAMAERRGDLGYFARPTEGGTVDPAIAEAVFALDEPGEVAGPIETGRGWTILYYSARREGFSQPLETVGEAIRDRLYSLRRAELQRGMFDDVVASAEVVYHDDAIAQLEERLQEMETAARQPQRPRRLAPSSLADGPEPVLGNERATELSALRRASSVVETTAQMVAATAPSGDGATMDDEGSGEAAIPSPEQPSDP